MEKIVLDLFVSEEELMELDRDIRPLWQEGGMRCPADGCDVFLECMTKCRRHWVEIHTEYIYGFQCTLCRFATMTRNQIIRHMGRVHPNQPTEGLEPRTFSNRKYSDPGNGIMPICEVSDNRRQFRDQEAKRRKSLVAGIETPLVKEDTNSRDQVVFAYDTETVIVIKKLWEQKSKEKVVRLRNI
uniref:C2H2-type domain-containing protein n=1 Tax=Magallana gigas TaxID=29159 RepID=K1PNR1_MAGGI